MSDEKFDVDDALKTAQILHNEGLLEDAKHTLRQVLARFPEERRARVRLEEIQNQELTQLLKEVDSIPKRRRAIESIPRLWVEDSDTIIKKLDQDLDLKMKSQDPTSLFGDEEQLKAYAEQLEKDLVDLPAITRIDVGIGFLEMGLFEIAAKQFQAAIKNPHNDTVLDLRTILSATQLLAYALIQADRAFDAILMLELTLSDQNFVNEDKTELMYLMGRAHQKCGQNDIARMWYIEVKKKVEDYRDVDFRLRTL